jgi:hypothetical protein
MKTAVLLTASTAAMFTTALVTAQEASAANLILAPGAYTADTSTLKLTGPGTNITGLNIGGVAVFKFNTINIPSGATITATGKRPFELMAVNSLILGGSISATGTSAATQIAGPNAGGAGGGAGGADSTAGGGGPGGGGKASNTNNGGGGAGFAGKGARGGVEVGGTGTAGSGGAAYGNLNLKLQGGSGGAGASNVGGGGGGGAIGLFGSSVTIQSTGSVVASGGAGGGGAFGGSGGGSGGGIIVHGTSIEIDGVLVAVGGSGGGGGGYGDGGGGAGGRIALQYKSFISRGAMVTVVTGGSSGTSGPYGHGGLSPDVAGANGLLTVAHIDASVLTIGASKTVKKGTAVTVATRLTDRSTAKPIAKQKVTLYKRTSTSGLWSKVATKTTSSTGRASVLVAPTRFTQFQWRYGGALVHDPVKSPLQSISIAS